MSIFKTIYNISMALAFATALAFTSCTTDDDGGSPTVEDTSTKGLYLQPTIAGNTIGQTTRADEVASSYSLQESKISEMYLAIGLEWDKGNENKTGQYYIFRKKGIEITVEGNVLMVEGKSWKETIKEACGYNVAVPVDVYVIANPRESFDATAGLDKVVSDLTKMKKYLQTPQEEKTEQGDNPIYQLYDATLNPNKNFLMYGHTRWTPNETGDTATIRVNLNRVAAKIAANVVINSSNYELVEDNSHTPSCKLTNYTNSALPTEDFQYTVETETETTTDGVKTWSYSEEVVKETLTANTTIAVETTPVSVTMKKSEGITGYEITTYSYPFSWAGNPNNKPVLNATFYIREKGKTNAEVKTITAEIPVTNTNVTALERNHIYTANYVLNLLGSDVDVTYPSSVSYGVQTWAEENVKGVDKVETTYTIVKEVEPGKADIKFDGFEWTSPVLCDGNKTDAVTSDAFDGSAKTNSAKTSSKKYTDASGLYGKLNANLTVTINNDNKGLTIDPAGNEENGDCFNFYIKDTKTDGTVVWYKFTITWKTGASSGTTTEETMSTISAESAVNAIGTDGYYYVDLSRTTVTDYVIAQPTSTSYDVVSPAFVMSPISSDAYASENVANSVVGISVSKTISETSYKGWRLPTPNEISLIYTLKSGIFDTSKTYLAYDGKFYTGDGTANSSATTGYIIAIHDLTASELQALE